MESCWTQLPGREGIWKNVPSLPHPQSILGLVLVLIHRGSADYKKERGKKDKKQKQSQKWAQKREMHTSSKPFSAREAPPAISAAPQHTWGTATAMHWASAPTPASHLPVTRCWPRHNPLQKLQLRIKSLTNSWRQSLLGRRKKG